MIEKLDERLLEALRSPMSDKARDLLVGIRTDIAGAELDDDRRWRFPWTFTASNGIELTLNGDGCVRGPNPGRPGWAEAVLEMLAADSAERATWRWTVDGHFIVIRSQMPHLDECGQRWAHCFDTRLLAKKLADPNYAGGVSWYCSDWSAPPEPDEISAHAATHAYFDVVPIPGYTPPQKMRR